MATFATIQVGGHAGLDGGPGLATIATDLSLTVTRLAWKIMREIFTTVGRVAPLPTGLPACMKLIIL